MANVRKKHSALFKMKVASEAITGNNTIAEIASRNGVHPMMVSKWKKQAIDAADSVFLPKSKASSGHSEAFVSRLYEQVGKLQVELDWLKKKSLDIN